MKHLLVHYVIVDGGGIGMNLVSRQLASAVYDLSPGSSVDRGEMNNRNNAAMRFSGSPEVDESNIDIILADLKAQILSKTAPVVPAVTDAVSVYDPSKYSDADQKWIAMVFGPFGRPHPSVVEAMLENRATPPFQAASRGTP